jgi:glycine/D-amino acid oxidase-like deaminating enzyme
VVSRLSGSPGLPAARPTRAFWQRDPPFQALVQAQSATLPAAAELVVVGSGMSGAAAAWAALRWGSGNVVVLEARELCSGATGRNGGHIKVGPHDVFAKLRPRLGAARARGVVAFQMRHLPLLVGMAAVHDWPAADAREVETVDLFVDDAAWREAARQVDELRVAMPEFAEDMRVWPAAEAQEVRGVFPVPVSACGAS